jgi:hypothetical protein
VARSESDSTCFFSLGRAKVASGLSADRWRQRRQPRSYGSPAMLVERSRSGDETSRSNCERPRELLAGPCYSDPRPAMPFGPRSEDKAASCLVSFERGRVDRRLDGLRIENNNISPWRLLETQRDYSRGSACCRARRAIAVCACGRRRNDCRSLGRTAFDRENCLSADLGGKWRQTAGFRSAARTENRSVGSLAAARRRVTAGDPIPHRAVLEPSAHLARVTCGTWPQHGHKERGPGNSAATLRARESVQRLPQWTRFASSTMP